jgi:hypothetical protein
MAFVATAKKTYMPLCNAKHNRDFPLQPQSSFGKFNLFVG